MSFAKTKSSSPLVAIMLEFNRDFRNDVYCSYVDILIVSFNDMVR